MIWFTLHLIPLFSNNKSDSALLLYAVRVKVPICPAHLWMRKSNHIWTMRTTQTPTPTYMNWYYDWDYSQFVHCTCSLFARFSSMDLPTLYATCIQTNTAHSSIEWVRKCFIFRCSYVYVLLLSNAVWMTYVSPWHLTNRRLKLLAIKWIEIICFSAWTAWTIIQLNGENDEMIAER